MDMLFERAVTTPVSVAIRYEYYGIMLIMEGLTEVAKCLKGNIHCFYPALAHNETRRYAAMYRLALSEGDVFDLVYRAVSLTPTPNRFCVP